MKSRPIALAACLFVPLCCARAQSDDYSTTRVAPPAGASGNEALAQRACIEFQDADVWAGGDARDHREHPAGEIEPGSNPGTAGAGAPGAAGGAAGGARAEGGDKSDKGRRGLHQIPYTISLLCKDEAANRDAIAVLYQTLKGRSSPGNTASGTSSGASPKTAARTIAPPATDAGDDLTHLQNTALRFIKLRVDNEIENNLREKTWTTIDNGRILRNQFVALEEQVSSGQFRSNYRTDPQINKELDAIYLKVHSRVADLGVDSALHDVEETQGAWIAYRDAWLAFIGSAYPQMSREVFANYLTRERIQQLREFYATGDR
jgi:uncharacterized protein YecT (DUF1311 family)